MVKKILLLFSSLLCLCIKSGSAAKDKLLKEKPYSDNTLWKKEYEEELNDALSTRKNNYTRNIDVNAVDSDLVLEKLLESITSSEKYLKKVDNIQYRLNRMDVELHEKTNTIITHLSDLLKQNRAQSTGTSAELMEARMDYIKTELNTLKALVEQRTSAGGEIDTSGIDARITNLEGSLKQIQSGVDTVVNIISEVKNRRYPKPEKQRAEVGSSLDALSIISEFKKTIMDQKKKCDCSSKAGRVDRSERFPTDCYEIQKQGFNISGIYKIKPEDSEPFYVLCDLITAGGGWTVFHNRFDGSQDFYKTWLDYKHGFGNLAGEFWLGLEKLSYLTNQKLYELRVEMEASPGQEAFASFSVFTVGPEHESYRISTLGTYRGTAGDSLSYHAGQKFSTLDVDNDEWADGSCATEHGGAWWYKECDKSNLNGKYALSADEARGQTIYWITFKGPTTPLMKSKMMIRPLPATKPIEQDYGRRLADSSQLTDSMARDRGAGSNLAAYNKFNQPRSYALY